MAVNPYEAYKKQSVLTMTQGEMLNKLYEEAVKQLEFAQVYIENKDYAKTNDSLKRAQKIILHLRSTLNFQYEISNNLASLYDYFVQRIVEANVKKDVAPLKEITPMIKELKDTFAQADKLARKG